jgi:tetratricopeptide (TPR) repeat protein
MNRLRNRSRRLGSRFWNWVHSFCPKPKSSHRSSQTTNLFIPEQAPELRAPQVTSTRNMSNNSNFPQPSNNPAQLPFTIRRIDPAPNRTNTETEIPTPATEPIEESESIPVLSSSDLLQKAARCYANAGWTNEACRIFEQMGDDDSAAREYEQQGNWERASHHYAKIESWRDVARCYLACNRPDKAAEYFDRAGDTLRAAWIWADLVHRFQYSETMVQSFNPSSVGDQIAVELIMARCEVGKKLLPRAAKRLRVVIHQLQESQIHRQELYDWTLSICEALHRPDLAALTHAAAVSINLSNSYESWEIWAIEKLGDATGIPSREPVRTNLSTAPAAAAQSDEATEANQTDTPSASESNVATTINRLVLVPRSPQRGLLYWEIPEAYKEAIRQRGGQRIALRLYDVTGLDLSYQTPHSVQQFECSETARDQEVSIPMSDRDYIAEIGYLTMDQRWLRMARSIVVRVSSTEGT